MSKILVRNSFRIKFFKNDFLVFSFWDFFKLWSHDVIKGSRNEFEILIVSDMVQGFQHDANKS